MIADEKVGDAHAASYLGASRRNRRRRRRSNWAAPAGACRTWGSAPPVSAAAAAVAVAAAGAAGAAAPRRSCPPHPPCTMPAAQLLSTTERTPPSPLSSRLDSLTAPPTGAAYKAVGSRGREATTELRPEGPRWGRGTEEQCARTASAARKRPERKTGREENGDREDGWTPGEGNRERHRCAQPQCDATRRGQQDRKVREGEEEDEEGEGRRRFFSCAGCGSAKCPAQTVRPATGQPSKAPCFPLRLALGVSNFRCCCSFLSTLCPS